jgi:2-oxoglutarate ferredoxin oxidoreductase subunit beta
MQLEVVKLGENGITANEVLVHDETNSTLAFMLARMPYPEFPVALGVLFAEDRPTYDGAVVEQQATAVKKSGKGSLQKLLNSGSTWEI